MISFHFCRSWVLAWISWSSVSPSEFWIHPYFEGHIFVTLVTNFEHLGLLNQVEILKSWNKYEIQTRVVRQMTHAEIIIKVPHMNWFFSQNSYYLWFKFLDWIVRLFEMVEAIMLPKHQREHEIVANTLSCLWIRHSLFSKP